MMLRQFSFIAISLFLFGCSETKRLTGSHSNPNLLVQKDFYSHTISPTTHEPLPEMIPGWTDAYNIKFTPSPKLTSDDAFRLNLDELSQRQKLTFDEKMTKQAIMNAEYNNLLRQDAQKREMQERCAHNHRADRPLKLQTHIDFPRSKSFKPRSHH